MPIVLGATIGSLPVRKYTFFGAIATTILSLIAIYIPGLSGFICIVMAIGLIAPFIYLSYVVTRLYRRYKQLKDVNQLPILLAPLIPFLIAAPLEHFMASENQSVHSVSTKQVFHYTNEQVFDAIKSVDTLDAERPWLMSFDLPVPTKCILEKEEVGGLRTCYFDKGNLSNGDFGGGTIVEKITAIERGKILKMDVIDYNLVGRNWLGFKEAIYLFKKTNSNECELTRVTTYTSVLKPRWYWEPMEELGIQQEHEYVFRNLAKDLQKMFVNPK